MRTPFTLASGIALLRQVLKAMAYTQVYHIGAFDDSAESDGAGEKPSGARV
jgi:hypothetical protein